MGILNNKTLTEWEEHHLRILEETFGGADDHYVLHNGVLCAKNGCKSLSSSEVKKYS